ncbi:Beta-N-acetylhexosaminidase [Rhodospirillum rubrum ATCC 11170]|uniref:beta-N-acetylhexosaminidase n=1 Tax=Rhodospirillum rubrum (strain ATCC 11170 / ATH 1.1.1 / DSM 467 / LMG 4362 / NCIMB 8255 / S1) TaxID=269796 RepID=Q2RTG8_RHORT|nr:beta-N-acetylhexosaminidase [Rhodospirillum rubrum]ABC22577.1 Beta-N-acetylhexosaminidase [Rhodospirillum rubrum ATCC 11170]MBK5954166.1 beta-N-acetylhexosaminidase [Rhodospirillum rubrum]HAQ00248.1 beta-N-acetylhexosaminidase [Rhodospirillum rubrum]HCF18392.1 beta-N-acetylhexosaminidase [Rhodospirillum rubrum]
MSVNPPLAVILGVSGPALSPREVAFFREIDPFGFILFGRNVESPDQVRALTEALRACVGRDDAPILIDQEGGRVQRLGPPHWRKIPPAEDFGALYGRDREAGVEAARLNARLIAHELRGLGIDTDCLPVLDVRQSAADDIVGDRAYSDDPGVVAALGAAVAQGLLAGGVFPVIKHIPGHGRAHADSHLRLPVVDNPLAELDASDFLPFKALADAPFAMTAHILYTAIDAGAPATLSAEVVSQVIRGVCGFTGLLMTDDLSMKALEGPMEDRTRRSFAAGCDLVLHCNGDRVEMDGVARAARAMDLAGLARWQGAKERLGHPTADYDAGADLARLLELMG